MDHYEVRRWGAWYRYVTLCLLAHAFLVVTRRAATMRKVARKRGGPTWTVLIPLTVPEVRRRWCSRRPSRSERRGSSGSGWSSWRRTHQAVAARCRKASRAAKRAPGAYLALEDTPQAAAIPRCSATRRAPLTDEQWAMVVLYCQQQRGTTGRPPLQRPPHGAGGICGLARTGSSWREMPEEYGKWERAYRRHELWVKQGLWQRVSSGHWERKIVAGTGDEGA